jgi:hypothetical protein
LPIAPRTIHDPSPSSARSCPRAGLRRASRWRASRADDRPGRTGTERTHFHAGPQNSSRRKRRTYVRVRSPLRVRTGPIPPSAPMAPGDQRASEAIAARRPARSKPDRGTHRDGTNPFSARAPHGKLNPGKDLRRPQLTPTPAHRPLPGRVPVASGDRRSGKEAAEPRPRRIEPDCGTHRSGTNPFSAPASVLDLKRGKHLRQSSGGVARAHRSPHRTLLRWRHQADRARHPSRPPPRRGTKPFPTSQSVCTETACVNPSGRTGGAPAAISPRPTRRPDPLGRPRISRDLLVPLRRPRDTMMAPPGATDRDAFSP